MPWVPMTSAGASPVILLGQEASQNGSTIYGNAGVSMHSSGWIIEGPWPAALQRFRVRVISYEQGGVGSPGFFEHRSPGGDFISTPVEGAGFVFELSRSETFAGDAELSFRNSGRDSEVYASDGHEMVIEVFVDIKANDDEDEVNIGESTATPVLANDTIDDGGGERPVTLADLDGLPVIVREPEHGTATVNSDGTITYTPNPGTEATEDSYEYEIFLPDPVHVLCGVVTEGGMRIFPADWLPDSSNPFIATNGTGGAPETAYSTENYYPFFERVYGFEDLYGGEEYDIYQNGQKFRAEVRRGVFIDTSPGDYWNLDGASDAGIDEYEPFEVIYNGNTFSVELDSVEQTMTVLPYNPFEWGAYHCMIRQQVEGGDLVEACAFAHRYAD